MPISYGANSSYSAQTSASEAAKKFEPQGTESPESSSASVAMRTRVSSKQMT